MKLMKLKVDNGIKIIEAKTYKDALIKLWLMSNCANLEEYLEDMQTWIESHYGIKICISTRPQFVLYQLEHVGFIRLEEIRQ